ncbi:hypothetical protein [Streptomyces prasinopilosus]|nr:hypothetical protein [Streptomyces prasinopilosus]
MTVIVPGHGSAAGRTVVEVLLVLAAEAGAGPRAASAFSPAP